MSDQVPSQSPVVTVDGSNLVNVPAASEKLLGSSLGLNMQAGATYPLFTVPAGKSIAVTHVVIVLVSGSGNITGDDTFALTSVATNGINDYSSGNSGAIFDPLSLNQVAMFVTPNGGGGGTTPLYLAGDTFELINSGGTDAFTVNVYVYGIVIP